MRRGEKIARIKRHLQRHRAAPLPGTALAPAEQSPPARRGVRLTVAILVALASLWIVAEAIGAFELPGRSDRYLDVAVHFPSKPESALEAALQKRELFVSVTMETRILAHPEMLRWMEHKPAPGIQPWPSTSVELRIQFWQDKEFTRPAALTMVGDHRLRLLVTINRELNVAKGTEPKGGPQTEADDMALAGPEITTFAPSKDGRGWGAPRRGWAVRASHVRHVYKVTLTSRSLSGMPDEWPRLAEYGFDLDLKKPLAAAKGLAQFHWRQSLDVGWSEDWVALTRNKVSFDQDYDDLKVIQSERADSTPTALTNRTGLTTITETATVRATPYDYTGTFAGPLFVHGTNSIRKDFVDFLVFCLAALFGVAAAWIFEIALAESARRS